MDYLKRGTWAEAGDFGILNLVGRWLRHDSGATERTARQLTRWGGRFIVRAIPEDPLFQEISSIWEIPVYFHDLVPSSGVRSRTPEPVFLYFSSAFLMVDTWQSRLAHRLPFYYGWMVFGAAVGVAYSARPLMAVATLSIFVVPMTQEFGWSRGLFSGAVSAGGLVAVAISPLAGRVIDRYGGGVVVASASAISGICAVGLSLISQPWAFYGLYVPARAVFAGPLELGTSTAVSNWFIRRRSLALALLLVGQGTGLALMPLVAQLLIGGWGWRAAWASLGIFTLSVGI
jgi:hypothetical protein